MATTTPQPIPLPSTANLVNSVDLPYLTFPPFPKAPEGVIIMPFKEFKEGGICVEPGPDDAEVDTLGIPTVPIKVRHDTDWCKSKTKRKRKAESLNSKKKSKPTVQRLWWEQWEDAEAVRFATGFHPNASSYEKIIAAAADFANGRVWPINFASESGPKFIWEKFQRYLGVQEGVVIPPPPKKNKKPATVETNEDEDDFSDDMDIEEEDGDGPGIMPDPVTGLIDVKKVQVPAASGKPKQPTSEEKLKTFFDDPEKSIKVFMTSYSRSMGYIWANANLDCIPRVLLFFVNFLLRSKILPEIERELRRSLEVIKLALTELPNTSSIAKTFPDKFNLAFNACWGQKADGYTMLITDVPENEPENELQSEPKEPVDESETKAQKLDADIIHVPHSTWPTNETPKNPTNTWASSGDGGWANDGWGDGGWGATAEDSSWGQNVEVVEENPWASLTVDKPESLLSFLGPTALPLTHSTGIVERSMRRIVSITRPPPSVAKSPPLADGILKSSPEAVELELDRHFAKIVLAPMIDWDGGEAPVYTRPVILVTSRGAVVGSDAPAQPTTSVQGSPQPYNPMGDEITWLIENVSSQIDYLREGMAIGGTWVQLARQGDSVVQKKKKKKSSYWYLDELAIIVPSFWAVA